MQLEFKDRGITLGSVNVMPGYGSGSLLIQVNIGTSLSTEQLGIITGKLAYLYALLREGDPLPVDAPPPVAPTMEQAIWRPPTSPTAGS